MVRTVLRLPSPWSNPTTKERSIFSALIGSM